MIVNVVSLIELGLRHDAHTMAMIDASGGLEEAFVLPYVVIVPGACCAAAGAAIARTAAAFYSGSANTKSA